MAIADILKIIQQIIDLEKKVEETIADEKDKARREKLAKAIKDRDLDAIRHLLFDLD
jgi:hypothetical protein